MRKKITVVGAGHVGEMAAFNAASRELGDVVLIDILEGMPQGKALDMWENAPIHGYDSYVTGTNDYADTADSDVVIITAGMPRKPGMSRDDLLQTNYKIMNSIAPEVAKTSPNAHVIVVSNPLDVMVQTFYKVSGFPKERVVGMAGVLDTARFRSFIALETGVSVENIQAMVLGGHGDTMVPLVNYTSISGIPVNQLVSQDRLDAIVDRTRNGGAEIVKLLKTGSAYYAPGAAAVEMAESILKDKKKILPCAARLEGEYGVDGLFVGVPVMLGSNGIEKIIEVELNDDEKAMFAKSVEHVQKLVDELNLA
jgi:malate dehydrogenase